MRIPRNWRRSFAVLAAAAVLCIGAGVAEAGGPSLYLTAEDLTGAGLHLPSYMPTVDGLMAYQERLPFHQMLVVRWDARPGAREMVLKEEADKTPLSPGLRPAEARHEDARRSWENPAPNPLGRNRRRRDRRGQADPRLGNSARVPGGLA